MEARESTSSFSKSTSGGALKLLDDLDELASLLGTDLSKPRVWKSSTKTVAEETTFSSTKKVELGKVSSSKKGEKLREAIESGRLDTVTGTYTHVANSKFKLAEALEKELINPDSAAFFNPENGDVMDIHHAITHGFMQKSGHYMDLQSGKRLKLKECLDRGIIVLRDVEQVQNVDEAEADEVFVPPLDLSEKHVVEVLDPSTGEWIPVSVSMARGIYNASTEKYFNMKTGELLTSLEAAQRNMVKLGDKPLESSMDSTDTDVLLEGHITGLKGKDINYSGEILSDDDNDGEEFMFTSSPRKDIPDNGAQAIYGTSSQLSTAALTSGSHDEMLRVGNESGEGTPTDVFDAETVQKADDTTPNHEVDSFGSNSSFVVTQSITVYEQQQTTSQHLTTQTTQRLMSMIATREVIKGSASNTFIEESDSTILSANTSDVTLDISNVTSGDTTHEEVTFPTPPPPIYTKASETELLSHGSSTTSYQSSIFADKEAVPPEVTDDSTGFSIQGTLHQENIFSVNAVVDSGEQSFPVSEDEKAKAFNEDSEHSEPKGSHEHSEDSETESVTFKAAPGSQPITTSKTATEVLQTTTMVSPQAGPTQTRVPIVNALLETMHRKLSATEPDETSTSYKQSSNVSVDTTPESLGGQDPRMSTPDKPVSITRSDQNTLPVKDKIAEKLSPNLVTSLTKHLEDKKSIIARTESVSSRSGSEGYTRSPAKALPQGRESETAVPASPSLKQLSQQLAMEAVQQRNSIRNRDGLMVSGLVKPSQRVANWKELEKKSMADVRAKPAGSSFQWQRKSTTTSSDDGISTDTQRASTLIKTPTVSEHIESEDTVTSGNLDIGSQDGKMHKDGNNNLKNSLSTELLAKVDAALESFETDAQVPDVSSARSLTGSLTPGASIDSGSNSLSGRSTSTDGRMIAKSPDGAQSRVMGEVMNWQAKERTSTKERTLSPPPNKLANVDSKSSSKVTFTYDSTVKRHKVTVYEHAKTISYEIAVKLGLVNIKTGRFRIPNTGAQLSVRQACLQGYIDENLPAITDIQTGHVWKLKQCVEHRLIDLDTGRVSDTTLKNMQISVSNYYIPSLVVIPPTLNIMDAVKVGLLNPHTGQFSYAVAKELLSCSLEKAIAMKYIHGEATLVQNPQTQKFHFLSEAIKKKLVDGLTGNILDISSGLMYMTFYGALLCGVYRSVYDVSSTRLLHSTTGQLMTINEAITTSLLGHGTCLVYDTEQLKQVSFNEAVAKGIVNQEASSYVDKKTSTSFPCEKAVEFGLIELIGAEVCVGFNLSDCVERLYPPPSESHRAMAQTDVGTGSHAEMKAEAGRHRKQPVAEPEIIAVSAPGGIVKDEHIDQVQGAASSKATPDPSESPPTPEADLPSHQSTSAISISTTSKPKSVSSLVRTGSIVRKKTPATPKAISPMTKGNKAAQQPTSPTPKAISPRSPLPMSTSPLPKPTAKDIRSNVIVTERVIEIESKKRPQVSAHSDNISATEYFTKGDVQVEIPVEDESPIDNYQVKISNAEPEEFDWEKLPISPLRERKIVVESKERVAPLRDKEIIIIEREEQGITIDAALNSGYINCETKTFSHPVTKETVSLGQAIEKGYITNKETEVDEALEAFKRKGSVMEYKSTKDVEYLKDELNKGISFKEAIEWNQIDVQSGTVKQPGSLVTVSLADAIASKLIDGDSAWFISPSSKRLFSITEAITNNVMDSHGFWCSQLSGLKKSFAEGLTHGYIKLLTPDDQTRCILTIVKKFAVHGVIHPVSMERIDYNVAVLEGIVNTVEGVYKSPATGDTLLIDDAIAKGLIRGALLSTRTNRELLPDEPTVTEKKCYTITHAKDTSSGKNLSINEARTKGILDEDLTTFTDLTSGRQYSIQEAIDSQYLVAVLDDPSATSKGARFVSTKVHRISSVVNPRTKQEIPADQAVKEGIINEETGDYVNLDDEKINMSNAIEKGLVKTRPAPTPVNNLPSFSITAITNPINGELMTVTDALRHGFLDRGRKHFFNPSTNAVYSLIEAINNGWVHVKSNMDTRGLPPYGQLQHPPSNSMQQTFTILSVRNVKLGEEVSVSTAIAQGLLDSSKQKYRNNMSGEVMSLDQAIKQNLITLVPTGYTSTKPAAHPAYPTIKALSTPSTPTLQTRRRHPSQNSQAVLLPVAAITTVAHPNANTTEPVYSQIRKDHTRNRSAPNQLSTQLEAIDIYKANTRGLISHAKGEMTVPQYGVTMLIDDALIQGFVTTGVPINMLLSRPFDPSSFAIFEAFKRGFVNPVTLSVRHPATGQFMSMESALTSGLLQPRLSSNSPPTHPTLKTTSLQTKKVRRTESLGRAETDRRRIQRNATLHTSTKQQAQSQEYHNYSQPLLNSQPHYQTMKPSRTGLSLGHGSGNMTLTTNRSGSHLVNGKLYSSKSGHIINSNGQVVNLSDGEVMSLAHAERLGVVQRLVDNDSHLAQSYVPAANMMFNRDPVSFSPKAEDNGVTVVHIRHHHSSDDSLGGEGLYSTLPSNRPINGSTTLPTRFQQLNDHYAEIRH